MEDDSTLPLAFGFKAPPEGYATDGSGTYALFSATQDGLGTWKSQVAHLTSANAFQVLLDAGKARIYAYYDTLKTFVPVLWVDRQGHWVSFTWQENDSLAGKSCSVRALNPDGKGVQVEMESLLRWSIRIQTRGECIHVRE